MNIVQKERIAVLRAENESYNRIAEILGISVNTVKSYCRRNNLGGCLSEVPTKPDTHQIFCRQCGKELSLTPGKKAPKFCCGECRVKWWNSHPDKVNRKAVYSFTCSCCGLSFTAYGNIRRKYCSHECYVNFRFKNMGETE